MHKAIRPAGSKAHYHHGRGFTPWRDRYHVIPILKTSPSERGKLFRVSFSHRCQSAMERHAKRRAHSLQPSNPLGRAVMPSKRSIRKSESKAQESARKLAILVNGKVLVSRETQRQLAEKAVQLKMETQKREFVLDTGASYHVCCEGWLTKKERKSICMLPEPLFLNAADGIVEIRHVVTVYVSDLRTP